MKYKIIGIISLVLVFAASIMASFITSEDKGERYIEHIKAEEKMPCEITHLNGELCTHLPIIRIETNGTEIPGRPIYDENGKVLSYEMAADGNETILAQLDTIENKNAHNHLNDTPFVSSKTQIRIRGNSSRTFEKPGYAIRLINDDLTNNPKVMLGMDAHHEWALHGPCLDKTLIRNYMWYNIAGEIMEYSPNVRFCEVVLNGEYQGLYLLTETVTAGKEGARLNLEVSKKDNSFSGYIIRMDRPAPEKYEAITPFARYSLRTQMQHEIIYPGINNLNDTLKKNIKNEVSYLEKVMYSYDYNSEKYGLETLLDIESFVDYFILNEITCNYDAGTLSTYLYKDIDGKYKMCVWDFNNSCDNYQETIMPRDEFWLLYSPWFVMPIKDEAYTDRIIERYYELRKTVLSDEYLEKFIDETIEYLGSAIERNNQKWGFALEGATLYPKSRNPENYEDAVGFLKTFLKERLQFMDENIETISQYSAESKVKKFNEVAN